MNPANHVFFSAPFLAAGFSELQEHGFRDSHPTKAAGVVMLLEKLLHLTEVVVFSALISETDADCRKNIWLSENHPIPTDACCIGGTCWEIMMDPAATAFYLLWFDAAARCSQGMGIREVHLTLPYTCHASDAYWKCLLFRWCRVHSVLILLRRL